MSIHREFQTEFPLLSGAYRRLLNKHFTMAADQYRDYPSDSSLAKHDDEYRAAETEFITLLVATLRNARPPLNPPSPALADGS